MQQGAALHGSRDRSRYARESLWVVILSGVVLFGGMLLRAAIWQGALGAQVAEGATASVGPTYLMEIYYPTYCRLDGLLFGVLLAASRTFKPDQWQRAFGGWRVPGAGTIAILSYSTYLKLVSHGIELLLGKPAMSGIGGFVLYFAASFAVAAMLWLAVERPFLLLRDWLSRPRQARAVSPAAGS